MQTPFFIMLSIFFGSYLIRSFIFELNFNKIYYLTPPILTTLFLTAFTRISIYAGLFRVRYISILICLFKLPGVLVN